MKSISCLMVVALAVLLSGCGTPGTEPAGGAMSPADQQISKDVLNRLMQDPVTASSTFGVTVLDGVVTLQGSVASETIRVRALAVARGAPDVKDVVDRIFRRENPQTPRP